MSDFYLKEAEKSEWIREGVERERNRIAEKIDKLRESLLIVIDKPKEDCPTVAWNYSIAFIRNILAKFKGDLITIADKADSEIVTRMSGGKPVSLGLGGKGE